MSPAVRSARHRIIYADSISGPLKGTGYFYNGAHERSLDRAAVSRVRVAGGEPCAGSGFNRCARSRARRWRCCGHTGRGRRSTAFCRCSDLKRSDGRAFTQDDVKRALADLRERGWLEDMPSRDGYFRLQDDVRGRLYRELLDEMPVATLRDALRRLDRYGSAHVGYHWPLYDTAATVALRAARTVFGNVREGDRAHAWLDPALAGLERDPLDSRATRVRCSVVRANHAGMALGARICGRLRACASRGAPR